MNKVFKTAVALCVAVALSASLLAQTFTVNTAGLFKVVGATLVAIPIGGTISPGETVVLPWVSNNTLTAAAIGALGVTANPSGVSPGSFSWSTKGDVGVVTGTGGATATASVNTINENSRPLSATDRGQSKGRVFFNWINTPNTCGGQQMFFDIIKSFAGTNLTNVGIPPVVGPDCLKPNTIYTYSVDPIVSDNLFDQIGLDKYFWDISSITGATNAYNSTDGSSITFTTGATVPVISSVICRFGAANYLPLQAVLLSQASATKSISAGAATAVVTASGAMSGVIGATNCIPTFASGVNPLTLSIPTQSGVSYQWTFGTAGLPSNGWNTSPPQAGAAPYNTAGVIVGLNNTLTIADVGNQPGTITLRVTDACANVVFYNYTFNRSISVATNSLISFNNNCTTPGTAVTATLAASANLNNVAWATLTNWSFGASNPYSVTPSALVTPGVYTVNAGLGCGTATPYTVNVKPAALTYSASSYCFNRPTTNTPSISCTNAGVGTFAWNIPGASGITAVSPASALSNITTTATATSSTFQPTLIIATGCTTSTPQVTINISSVTPTGLAGSSCYNVGMITPGPLPATSGSLTVSGYPGYGTYVFTQVSATNGPWLFTGVVTGTGPFTNTFSPTAPNATTATTATFNFTNNFAVTNSAATPYCGGLIPGTYPISVSHVSGTPCAASTVFGPTNIVVAGYGSFTLTPTAGSDDLFKALGLPAGYSPSWFRGCPGSRTGVPISATIQTTPTFTSCDIFTTAGAGTTYSVDISLAGCTTTYARPSVNFVAKRANPTGTGVTNLKEIVKYYPNPNSGSFVIDVATLKETGTMTIQDITGKKVTEKSLKSGQNNFDLKLPTGIYQLHIVVDGQEQNEKMVITE
jgi:hypothetical protein